MPRSFAASSALLLLLPIVAVVVLAPAAQAATTHAFTISTASARPSTPFAAFDASPVKVFDFDGDGDLELLAQNDNRFVYVFDGTNGKVLAQLTTLYPPGWGARPINGPEAAILTHGGVPRIVAVNSAAVVTAFKFNEDLSNASKFVFTKEWERRLTDCYSNPGSDSKVVLADLDKDGDLEILAQTEEQGVFALHHNGQLMWRKCIGGGNGEPGVGDLDGDGGVDVVWASDGGVVTAMDGRTGNTKWTFWAGASQWQLGAASMPVGPTVAQLDGRGGADVVVGARDSSDCEVFGNNHAALFAIGGWGNLLWMRQENTSNPLTYTRPIVHDVDGNGQKDVLWGDWNTQGHKCGDWEAMGPANFYRYDAAGVKRWHQTLGTFWSNKDIALADVDNDGTQEVLANGPSGTHDGLWYLNSVTGAKEAFVSTYPWKVSRGPVLADLRGDGGMQVIVPVSAYAAPSSGGAIMVFDTNAPWDAAWPHPPYPQDAREVVAPPPGADFNATFTVKSPNEWWQEVAVKPETPKTLEAVEVRVNGGAWQPLTLRSWGAWAGSYFAAKGSKVEFLATATDNGKSQSLPFTWLDGNLTKGSTAPTSPDPPPPPPFEASFEVAKSVNNWWVDVMVRTGDPLESVEAQVNNGTWVALNPTTWGTWAKSFHVPTGASVVFRATNLFGQAAVSDPVRWLSGESGFTATFTPRSQANNWWVEVDVDSRAIIVGVDARVNSGSWVNLPATDWGTWAKSFFVADGAMVQFRARNDLGNEALSTTYRWG